MVLQEPERGQAVAGFQVAGGQTAYCRCVWSKAYKGKELI